MNAPASLLFFPAIPSLSRPKAGSLPTSPALERSLAKAVRQGRPVLLGTLAAPYVPDGSPRPLLTTLARTEGLEIAITTRSPRILRHLDILTDLDRRSVVTVRMLVPTVDPELAERLEP